MKSVLFSPQILFLGLASWLLPFVFSILFFDQTGQLVITKPLFKSIMIVFGGAIGVALLVLAFRNIEASWQSGLTIGCYWLALNLLLDILILVPLSGMTFGDYFSEIGLRYLLIPIIAIGMGRLAQQKTTKS